MKLNPTYNGGPIGPLVSPPFGPTVGRGGWTLGRKGVWLVAVGALVVVPPSFADRVVSVGYRTPAALHGLKVLSRVTQLRTAEIRVASLRAESALRERPGIRFVQRTVGRFDTGGPALASGAAAVPEWQWTAAHADLVPSWVQNAAQSVTIAVVDTGADVLAPAIAAKNPVTWNIVNGDSTVQDAVGHGTFVASLAGGSVSDPSGMLGFGGQARLMIVQANRGGTGFSDIDEANAIVYAVDHGANIINLSLGGPQTSLVERYAVDYATQHGVLLVAAAGNSAEQGNPPVYPAALIGRSGLVVGAASPGGARASFSTTGQFVDVLAPGVNVLGALAAGIPSGYFTPAVTPGANGAYGYGSGTSFAAPEVSGAAALVWAANPALDAQSVAATIEGTASGQGTWTPDIAFGDIDVAAAVERALGGNQPTLTAPAVAKPKAVRSRATKKAKRARP